MAPSYTQKKELEMHEATSKRVFEIPHILPSFYTQSPLAEFKFLGEKLSS